MKFPIKIRDIYKIENKENKKNFSIDVSKKCFEENNNDLPLIGETINGHYVFRF